MLTFKKNSPEFVALARARMAELRVDMQAIYDEATEQRRRGELDHELAAEHKLALLELVAISNAIKDEE